MNKEVIELISPNIHISHPEESASRLFKALNFYDKGVNYPWSTINLEYTFKYYHNTQTYISTMNTSISNILVSELEKQNIKYYYFKKDVKYDVVILNKGTDFEFSITEKDKIMTIYSKKYFDQLGMYILDKDYAASPITNIILIPNLSHFNDIKKQICSTRYLKSNP